MIEVLVVVEVEVELVMVGMVVEVKVEFREGQVGRERKRKGGRKQEG